MSNKLIFVNKDTKILDTRMNFTDKLRFLSDYLKYRIHSKNRHGVHSPFVYNLLSDILYDNRNFYFFKPIEILRSKLIRSEKEITVTDLGAGSSNIPLQKRKVKDIARHSAKPAKYGQLLFKIINHFQPNHILELGTSLGISTLYLASASSLSKVISIEGCPNTAAIARKNFSTLKLNNIDLMEGNFDTVLPEALKKHNNTIDFVFFDGNHKKVPTLNYFKQCLGACHNNTTFVFDDIYWSLEMKEAWEEIKNHPQVTVSIDLFFIGIVFFRKEQAKQNFIITY